MGVWHGPNGILVEAIMLGDRPMLRVSRLVNGRLCLQGHCASVAELGRHGVDLAQLVERPSDAERLTG
jgi:hypothetical protein